MEMKKYLFVDFNNGYETIYYPFLSNIELSNEEATKIQLEKYSFARRLGTNVNNIFTIIKEMGFIIEDYIAPGFDIKVYKMKNPDLTQWNVIDGICGNY